MKNFILSLVDLFHVPRRLNGYSVFGENYDEFNEIGESSTEFLRRRLNRKQKPLAHHPIPALRVVLIYLLFILVFGMALLVSGVTPGKTLALSLLLLAGGLIVGSLHFSSGLSVLLFMILLSTVNTRLYTDFQPTMSNWWMGFFALLVAGGVYVQKLAHPPYSAWQQLWRVLYGLGLIVVSLYVVYANLQTIATTNLLYSILLLAYTWSAPIKQPKAKGGYEAKNDLVSGLGIFLSIVFGLIVTWRWCALLVQDMSILLMIVVFPLAFILGCIGIAVLLGFPFVSIDTSDASTDVQDYFGAPVRWLYLLFYLSLQTLFEANSALWVASAALVLMQLTLIFLNKHYGKERPLQQTLSYMLIGFVTLSLAAAYLTDDTWMRLGMAILSPKTAISLSVLVLVFSAVVSSLFASTLVTSVLSIVVISGLLFTGYGISPLADNIFLLFGALVLGWAIGYLKLLNWPLLSLANYREAWALRKHTPTDERRELAINLVEYASPVPALGRDALMSELFARGLMESDLSTSSGWKLYERAKERDSQSYLLSDFSVADFALRPVFGLSTALQAVVAPLKTSAQLDISPFERTRVYARTLKMLREKKPGLSSRTRSRIGWPAGVSEADLAENIERRLVAELALDGVKYREAFERVEGRILPLIGEVVPIEIPLSDLKARLLIEQEFDTRLQTAIQFIEASQVPEREVPMWPRTEREFMLSLQEWGATLNSLLAMRFDFPSQRRSLQLMLDGLQRSRAALEPQVHLMAAGEPGSDVLEKENIWHRAVQYLIVLLNELLRLVVKQGEWARDSLVLILSKIDKVEKLPRLEKSLDMLAGLRESYDPIVDETIVRLRGIGREASSALAFPRGYSQRLGLQDTFERLSELRGLLSTRYLIESRDILGELNRLSEMLHQQLYADSDTRSGFRNPYQAGNPIQSSRFILFKGRRDLLQKLLVTLRSHTRPTFVLHGPRRMGKTSFLLQLPELLPSEFIAAYVDMQAGLTQSDGQFFYSLADAIFRQVGQKLNLEKPRVAAFNRKPSLAFTQWLDHLQPQIKGSVLLFTIDEFELIGKRIAERKLTIQVLEHLRHLMQHNQNIIFLFAGVQTLDALGPKSASYFIGTYPLEISYLSVKEATELIRNPDPSAGEMPKYNKDVVDEILRLTKCQPYLIQAICGEIIATAMERSLSRITRPVLDRAVKRVLSSVGSNYFKFIWEDAQKSGQDILLKIIANPRTRWGANRLKKLDELTRKHVVQKLEDGTYAIEVPLVEMWIRNQQLK